MFVDGTHNKYKTVINFSYDMQNIHVYTNNNIL